MIRSDGFGSIGVLDSSNNGATITNSEVIRARSVGVEVSIDPGQTTIINNAVGGTIEGSGAAISVLEGTVMLTNRGTITGGARGRDLLTGSSDRDFFDFNSIKESIKGANRDRILDLNSGEDDRIDLRDFLTGGGDRDIFDFNSIKDSLKGSNRDLLLDFVRGQDDIDLRTIDAKSGVSGNNAFKFTGKNDFSDTKGELRYIDKGTTVIVQGDVNGDGNAGFEIFVAVGALSAGDFLL